MTPPEPFYLLCPACGAPHRSWSRSGNTFGATTLWSDGVLTSEMLPPPWPAVARCAGCATYFWLEEARRFYPRDDVDHEGVLHLTEVSPRRTDVILALRAALGVSIGEAKRTAGRGGPSSATTTGRCGCGRASRGSSTSSPSTTPRSA